MHDMMTNGTMSLTAPDDAELVIATLSGNRDAFSQIVSRYQSLICSLAYSATGSLGHVDARLLSSSPRGAVRSFFAGPLVSRYSPHYGEELKGIAVSVTVQAGRRPVSVVIGLRQVCAQYFRNSFLYY